MVFFHGYNIFKNRESLFCTQTLVFDVKVLIDGNVHINILSRKIFNRAGAKELNWKVRGMLSAASNSRTLIWLLVSSMPHLFHTYNQKPQSQTAFSLCYMKPPSYHRPYCVTAFKNTGKCFYTEMQRINQILAFS